MSLRTDLTDLLASAPAQHRAAIDDVSEAVDCSDWDRAVELIDRVPTGLTSWHERLAMTRESIVSHGIDDDCGFLNQFAEY